MYLCLLRPPNPALVLSCWRSLYDTCAVQSWTRSINEAMLYAMCHGDEESPSGKTIPVNSSISACDEFSYIFSVYWCRVGVTGQSRAPCFEIDQRRAIPKWIARRPVARPIQQEGSCMDRQSRTHVAQERPPFSTINRHSYANNEDRTAATATVPAAPCCCLFVPHVARAVCRPKRSM
jgi:hypothetical protein